jgi:Kef-type K+ transport system membrane component KefB
MPDLAILLAQVALIVLVARVVGWLFRKVGQPQVMGEMVAGILLGPSLLGWVAPKFSLALFPPGSLGFLNSLSQIGLLLFMFMVGAELNPKILRGRRHTAVVTSHVSIIVPFLLGTLLALYLYPRLSNDSVAFTYFALFVGTAMSITAFPVLARILTERNLIHSHIGAVTIACAAVDDVTAWCILAGVVLLVRSSIATIPLWLTVTGSAVYVGFMWFGTQRALRRLGANFLKRKSLTQDMMSVILLLVLVSGWVTERLGIHALFGAFLMGVVMPKDQGFVRALREKLEGLTVVLLLPLYFAFTGLRTSIGLLSGADMWFFCGLIIVVAILGKFGGATFSARLSGMPWREAGAVGILMNTRGLMELVVLNIGLDIGVISPALFTMMVLMALVTTFMTTPLLDLVYPAEQPWRDIARSRRQGLREDRFEHRLAAFDCESRAHPN